MTSTNRHAHVYLSPHLDDAVLSSGGSIWEQVQAGESIKVVTIFAGPPDPDVPLSPFAQSLHARWRMSVDAVKTRQEEDREALARLGARPCHWSYRDAIYRRTPDGGYAYTSEDALWGSVHPSEAELVHELGDRIGELALVPRGTLYVPLAVGAHIDHRIVRWAAEGGGRALLYYEDFPYAEDPERVDAALGEGRWRPAVVPLSDEALEAKIAAVACYRSQMSSFWGSREEMAASVRAFAERIGGAGAAERYWRVTAS